MWAMEKQQEEPLKPAEAVADEVVGAEIACPDRALCHEIKRLAWNTPGVVTCTLDCCIGLDRRKYRFDQDSGLAAWRYRLGVQDTLVTQSTVRKFTYLDCGVSLLKNSEVTWSQEPAFDVLRFKTTTKLALSRG